GKLISSVKFPRKLSEMSILIKSLCLDNTSNLLLIIAARNFSVSSSFAYSITVDANFFSNTFLITVINKFFFVENFRYKVTSATSASLAMSIVVACNPFSIKALSAAFIICSVLSRTTFTPLARMLYFDKSVEKNQDCRHDNNRRK